jgi:hypothetical protein
MEIYILVLRLRLKMQVLVQAFTPTKRELRNMLKLQQIALSSEPSRTKHFAAVFAKKWHAFAENSFKECKDRNILKYYLHPFPHAEFALLRRLEPKSHDTVYVARFSKTGKPLRSAPCSQCRRFLIAFGIRLIFYTDAGGWIKERI